MDNIFNNKDNNFHILNDDLTKLFNIINKEMNLNELKFIKNYEKIMKNINENIIQRKYIDNFEKSNKFNKLFDIFKYDLENKKSIITRIKTNENLDILISKIFLFGIKYYNCFGKLNNLIKEINNYKNESLKEIINKIKKNKNYSLFYSFYETSTNIKIIYHKHKSNFNDSTFDKDMKEYFDDIFNKIDFLYNIIVPSDDNSLQSNISIINKLLDLIENNNIKINEIKQYSKLQNIIAKIKLTELSIINNLLFSLNNSDSITFLLYLVSKKIRNKYNKLNSFFDNIYGADYFIMEKLKYRFHLFLQILSYKSMDDKSIISQISIIENLIWKIRGRNFPILLYILKVFEEIKMPFKKNEEIFKLGYKNIYNIKYYNKRKLLEIKFEVFKILVNQILNKIKDILKDKEDIENDLTIERNPSKVSYTDFKELFKIIISYFIDINPESYYYYDINLFFY